MAHYEVLLFDADATLFDFNKSSKEAFRQTMEHVGIPYSSELFTRYHEINQDLWRQLELQNLTVEELRERRYKILFSEQSVSRDTKEADTYYLKKLSQLPYLVQGASDIIKRFSEKHRMAIITNGLSTTQHPRIEGSPIGQYFEHVFVSEEIGYTKPDTRFFDYVFSKMSPINRRRTLVVGDSLTADIKGAVDSGVHSCWYNPMHSSNHTSIHPTYEIHSLKELEDIV